MAAGVELPVRRAGGGGIAMEFPAGDEEVVQSPSRLPKRLRRRLLDVDCKSPSTVEEIEAKLRDADLRRQKYYEKLSDKARSKPRNSLSSSFQEEDRGLRLEEKLQAAEQKRLSILAKAQMRLARLDELRKAAKIRYEDERMKRRAKVESRVQQAEANRMLMIKACRQRRASLRERYSQLLLRRMVREEHVRAAIHKKRAAAEIKRLGLLEAEKRRAHARLLQVRHIVKSVSQQREMERRKKNDQLEDRIQKARRQRTEYLRQRGRLHVNAQENWNRSPKEAKVLSMKVSRCWRKFVRSQRTTLTLAKAFVALGINEKSAKSMPFEQISLLIESPSTLQVVKAVLDRIESRLTVSRAVAPANCLSSLDNIDHLLKQVAAPRSVTPRSSLKSRDAKKVGSVRVSNRSLDRLPRYLVRVVLCAYIILGHPDAVFSGMGEREIALAKSAEEFVQMFELLIKIILEGPIQCSDVQPDSVASKCCTFKSQLAAFDKAWCSYLSCFVIWKVKDAQLLEEDLVKAVCHLEASIIQTCKLTTDGDNGQLSHGDMNSIQHQVAESQRLLKEMVQQLSGNAGIEHMEGALSETRSRYLKVKDNGSPLGSPMTPSSAPSQSKTNVSPVLSMVSSSYESSVPVESNQIRSHVVRSLFENATTSPPGGSTILELSTSSDDQLGSSIKKLVTENEILVNEFLHQHHCSFSDGWGDAAFNQSSIEGKIKETMEKAFWDSIMESVKQDQPNYDQIVQLTREVRDEICEMAPQSWKEGIFAAIDIEIFSQALKSGNLDVDYLRKILEFSLVTLQKLSAPASEEKMKDTHQRLFSELTEICQSRDGSNYLCVMALIKGLRFVLEQIQTLKTKISKARIKLMEPLIKGPAGLDYLRNAFANRYGSPSDADTSLPSTLRWVSSLWTCKDQEWKEHLSLTSALEGSDNPSQGCLPSTTLQTGGNILVRTSGTQTPISTNGYTATGNQQPECKGETVDLVVRVGLLKLASRISGLRQEDLPETLLLNFQRLRSVQAQIQKIIVISTSILICRQILLTEKAVASPVDMENIISKRAEQLLDLLDRAEGTDIKGIVEVICEFDKVVDEDEVGDNEAGQLQARKVVAARMIAKSLQAGDAVFERVFNAVYSATRGVVLCGSGLRGRKLAEIALRRVGAAVMSKRLVEAAEVLIVAATISVTVHGQWYKYLTDSM